MAIGFTSNAQTFGGIRGKNNAGTQGDVKRTNDALKVADSISLVQTTKAALNLDTIKTYIRADSAIQADILDWTSSMFPNFDAYLVNIMSNQTNGTHMTQIRDSTGDKVQVSSDGKMYVHASQAGAWTVTATTDSNAERITHKISESALPSGAATETTLGSVLTSTQLIDDAVNTTGSAVTAKAIGISGTDGTNARMIATNSSGHVRLDSAYTRSELKISSMPAIGIDSNDQRISVKVIELPAGGLGGTQYAEGATTDPATGTAALMRYDATDLALTDEQMSMPLLSSRGEQRTLQTNGAVVSDVLTVNGDYVTIPCDGYSSIIFDKLGTFNMTIAAQFSPDGVTYTSSTTQFPFQQTTTNAELQTLQSTTQGQYIMNTNGAKSVRLLVTAYTSGTCSITAAPTGYLYATKVYNTSNSLLNVTLGGLSSGSTFYWAAEDSPVSPGGTVSKTGLLRQDAPTSSTSADADYIDAKATKFGSMLVKDEERHFRTYSAAFVVAPAASCTDLFELKAGTKNIKVNKITVTGYQTTGGVIDFHVIKRSTVNTGGSSTSAALVPHLTGDAAATAVGTIYTANPTLGTSVGTVAIKYKYIGTTTENSDELVYDFGERGKPIYLAGNTTQALALNLNARTASGGSIAVTIEWTEED